MTAHDELTRVITSMYEALGDRDRFDTALDPDIVMWESDADDLLVGVSALDALRDERRARAGDSPGPISVTPHIVHVDSWAETGVVRYELHATFASAPTQVFRVTDVLRRKGRTWQIVHHHAQEM